ncbi:TetR family regulatory protein [Burkholderia aenigmatica]|nr:TetR family regulatory protein [Burkholderia aenigmatica]
MPRHRIQTDLYTPAKVRPWRVKRSSVMSAKRQAVVDTATRLFSAFGYQAVGVDRIIAESSVSKMTMYKYFPSKDDLIVEVLRQRQRVTFDDLVAYANARSDPTARIDAIFDWHDLWINGPLFYGCMFINAATEHPEADSEIARASAMQKVHLRTFFEQLLKPLTGENRAPVYASKLMILIDGAIVAAQVYGNKNAAIEARDVARMLLSEAGKSA